MQEKLVQRKQRELEAISGSGSGSGAASVPDDQFIAVSGIKYKKVKHGDKCR